MKTLLKLLIKKLIIIKELCDHTLKKSYVNTLSKLLKEKLVKTENLCEHTSKAINYETCQN